jgi:hypothetical protein
MNRRRLQKLRRLIEALRSRKGSLRHADLEAVAKALGRRRDTSRGKEPTYVKAGWFPLSIPDHAGKTIAIGTATNILNQLEADADAVEQELPDDGASNNEESESDEG